MLDVRNTISALLCVLLLLLLISGPFISEMGPIHLVIAIVVAALLALVIALYVVDGLPLTDVDTSVFQFTVYLLLMSVYSAWIGHDLNDIIRGIIPFLFLPIAYFSIVSLNFRRALLVLRALFYVGVIVSLSVIPFLVLRSTGTLDDVSRLTAYSDMTHIPVILVSLVLMGLMTQRGWWKFALLILFLTALLATESRGQVAIGLMLLLAYPWIGGWGWYSGSMNSSERRVYIALVMLMPILVIALGSGLIERFSLQNLMGDTTEHRLEEIRVAYRIFMENVLIGYGPGTIFAFVSPVTGSEVEQRYIHNILLYILATGGLLGVVMFGLPFYRSFQLKVPSNARMAARHIRASIVTILLYGLVSATYKSIHVNVMLGMLLGSVTVLHRHLRLGVRAVDE